MNGLKILVKKMQKSNDYFRHFIAASREPVLLLAGNGAILDCNSFFSDLYNLLRTEIVNHAYPLIFSETSYQPPISFTDLAQGIATSIVNYADTTIQWSATRFSGDTGQLILLQGFDISDLLHASRKVREIQKSIVDFIPNHYIFWKDKNSVYLGCNQALAHSLGLNSPADIIGKTDYELPTPIEQSDAYRADDQEVMRSGLAKLNIEEKQTLPGGIEKVLLTSKVPLYGREGKIDGVLAIYSDITEQKKMQFALEQARINAETANQAKSEFIANMSHDLRTPISGIIGLATLLQKTVNTIEQKEYAQWIYNSGEQLLELLNGVLDIGFVEGIQEHDLYCQPFVFKELIDEIIQLELPTIKMKGLDLKIELDSSIPSILVTDRLKLHRILLNLIGNAIKFTTKGVISLRVTKKSMQAEQVEIEFSVTDTGIGIPQELQSRVFERFFRGSPSYKGVHQGHGVGLHIVQRYVELLKGDIKLDSQLGKGTTIAFTLPLLSYSSPLIETREDELILQKLPLVRRLDINDFVAGVDKPRILLVEDNLIALRIVESIVTQAGGDFISAIDGEKALALVKNSSFDLVITDIGLPGISGYELTEDIRKWEIENGRKSIPIIGLTAHALDKTEQICLVAGMNKVLTKPINLETMDLLIKQYMVSERQQSLNSCGSDLPLEQEQLFHLDSFPLLDVEQGINNLGGKKILQELLQLMIDQSLHEESRHLQAAYRHKNWTMIEEIAHRMKSGALYCGTIRLQYACQYLERYQKAGFSALLDALYQQLISVMDETTAYLNHWLKD